MYYTAITVHRRDLYTCRDRWFEASVVRRIGDTASELADATYLEWPPSRHISCSLSRRYATIL